MFLYIMEMFLHAIMLFKIRLSKTVRTEKSSKSNLDSRHVSALRTVFPERRNIVWMGKLVCASAEERRMEYGEFS